MNRKPIFGGLASLVDVIFSLGGFIGLTILFAWIFSVHDNAITRDFPFFILLGWSVFLIFNAIAADITNRNSFVVFCILTSIIMFSACIPLQQHRGESSYFSNYIYFRYLAILFSSISIFYSYYIVRKGSAQKFKSDAADILATTGIIFTVYIVGIEVLGGLQEKGIHIWGISNITDIGEFYPITFSFLFFAFSASLVINALIWKSLLIRLVSLGAMMVLILKLLVSDPRYVPYVSVYSVILFGGFGIIALLCIRDLRELKKSESNADKLTEDYSNNVKKVEAPVNPESEATESE